MAKRENESASMKDLLDVFINKGKLKKGFQRMNVEEAWSKLMGTGVSNYTNEVKLQNSTLIVRLSSSALREELGYGKDKIINMMNEELGEKLIKRLMLV